MPKRQQMELTSFVHNAADGYVIDHARGVGYAIGASIVVAGRDWTAHVRTGATSDLQLAMASVALTASDGSALTPAQLRSISWTQMLDLVADACAMPMHVEQVDGRLSVRISSDSLADFGASERSAAVQRSRRRAGLASHRSDDLSLLRQLHDEAELLGVSGRQHAIARGPWSRATVDRLRRQLREHQDDVD